MMQRQRRIMAVALASIAAVTLVSVAAGGPSTAKQRVAIDGRLDLATGKGTWTLTPLSPGLLKKDSGTAIGGGDIKPPHTKKNGQRVTVIIGKDSHTGKNGTFVITQRVEAFTVHGYGVDTGTWSFKSGTGAYAGVRGGGAFAASGPVNGGVLFARQEGYLYTP